MSKDARKYLSSQFIVDTATGEEMHTTSETEITSHRVRKRIGPIGQLRMGEVIENTDPAVVRFAENVQRMHKRASMRLRRDHEPVFPVMKPRSRRKRQVTPAAVCPDCGTAGGQGWQEDAEGIPFPCPTCNPS